MAFTLEEINQKLVQSLAEYNQLLGYKSALLDLKAEEDKNDGDGEEQ
jgi:hypothetical protein|tara:strand:+ start:81 stop:221 length:141 start_codon:yes stop_codon:yes gene_type:complete